MTNSLPLDPGEQVIWSGQPKPFRYALAKGWVAFAVGLVMALADAGRFLKYMEAGERKGMILAGFFATVWTLVVASPLWHLWRAKLIRYVITSKRILIQSTWPKVLRFDAPLSGMVSIKTRRRFGGLGDVLFESAAASLSHRERFIAIENADEVERILNRAMEKAKQ